MKNQQSFEPTLALIECRLAARHQERSFRPGDPLWVLFSKAELEVMFAKNEETQE